MDDLELLHRYISNGDKDAVSSLIHKYQKMVFGACMKRLGCAADAEDASQQVFMAMMQRGGEIRSSVSQWLYRCAINVSASIIRTRSSRAHREREKSRQTAWWCGNGEAERKETYSILMQCLGELDADDRKVLVDSHVNDVTQQAIASSMGVTQQAVAKRISRVMMYLRRELTSRGVIFSMLATVLLAVKRAASAAVPQSLKAAMSSAPSATLVSGGAAGAGTAGMLKASVAAVLVMAAAITYKCTENYRRETSDPQAKIVIAADEKHVAGGNATGGVCFSGKLPVAAPVSLTGSSPSGQAVQQIRQSGAAEPSNQGISEPIASGRADAAYNNGDQQKPQIVPQNVPDRTVSSTSPATFCRTSSGKGTKRAAGECEASEPMFDAHADELAEAAGGNAADKLPPAGAIPTKNGDRRADRQIASLQTRQVMPAGMKELNTARAWSDVRLGDTAGLPTFTDSGISYNQPKTDYPMVHNLDAISMSPVYIGGQEIDDNEWKISPAAFPSAPDGNAAASPGTITVADGDMLAAGGRLDERLINQGIVLAEDDAPLHLAGLVSGRGSYVGSVVFENGFSPGNSPAAVHLDYAVLDPGNTLTMELAGLMPGSQYDQLIIDNHLTLGGQLDVELIYGFMPGFGDRFTLFDGDFSGEFSEIILPTLGDGLRWDTSTLYTGGSLQVVQMVQAVPEPATLLFIIGGLGVLLRRRPA